MWLMIKQISEKRQKNFFKAIASIDVSEAEDSNEEYKIKKIHNIIYSVFSIDFSFMLTFSNICTGLLYKDE